MYLGRHFQARGYFVVTSVTIADEIIMEYIEKQDIEDKDGDFKVLDERLQTPLGVNTNCKAKHAI